MTNATFRVLQIDHVELYVPDQYAAAAWYDQVLGLKILPDYEVWASDGPLMISSDDGGTMLALFKGETTSEPPHAGFRRVAFRVDGQGFMQFLERLTTVPVYDADGEKVTAADVSDHGLSYSIYFSSPYGHRHEVTTYEYDMVKNHTLFPS